MLLVVVDLAILVDRMSGSIESSEGKNSRIRDGGRRVDRLRRCWKCTEDLEERSVRSWRDSLVLGVDDGGIVERVSENNVNFDAGEFGEIGDGCVSSSRVWIRISFPDESNPSVLESHY